jgi:hypothetical protein
MKLLTSLALVTLAYAAFARVGKVHATRTPARPAAKPPEVQTWEGEGGGLPTGGPGPGVKVAPAAVSDPDLAHGGVGAAR